MIIYCHECQERKTVSVNRDGEIVCPNGHTITCLSKRESKWYRQLIRRRESKIESLRPTRNERILEHGYQAYATEEGHYDQGDY